MVLPVSYKRLPVSYKRTIGTVLFPIDAQCASASISSQTYFYRHLAKAANSDNNVLPHCG